MSDIWRSKANPNEFFGHNKDLLAYNKLKGGVLLVEGDQALHQNTFINNEESNPSPPVVLVEKKKKDTKTKKDKEEEKVINIAVTKNGKDATVQVIEGKPEEPLVMPAVVGNENGSLGYGSSSLIRTGEEEIKMRKCLTKEELEEQDEEAQETPLPPTPKVVSK